MAAWIQTVDGPVPADLAGTVLAHEHLWAAFGAASGDPDLELTCDAEIMADLAEAAGAGVRTVVDVTTADMGANAERTAVLARAAGIQAVKSTGWFRSPTVDPAVDGRSAAEIADRLIEDVLDGTAGCLGEVGLTATAPTPAEEQVLDATAMAARATGVGVMLHTDDARNGEALVEALLDRGVPAGRLLVGHARSADPLEWHVALLERGCVLGFDQNGHPQRDPVGRVAARVHCLLERVAPARIVLSSDVGRRSRLRAFGGSGYASGPLAVLDALRSAGVADTLLDGLRGRTAAAFLAIDEAA
jgi:phosphotriesterase-related protein